MASEQSLKKVLKALKESENTVSMAIGALIVLVAAILLLNNLTKQNRTVISENPDVTLTEIPMATPTGEIAVSPTVTVKEEKVSVWQKAGQVIKDIFNGDNTAEVNQTTEEDGEYKLELVEDVNNEIRPVSLPEKHMVSTGETLWSIAEKYYGSGYNWVDLAKENGLGDTIEVGQEVRLPQVRVRVPVNGKLTVDVAKTPNPEVNPTSNTYIVKEGDTLWSIAQGQYNDGFRWIEIFQANQSLIKNPGIIETGWELVINR